MRKGCLFSNNKKENSLEASERGLHGFALFLARFA
jgi:hypothetical protein